MSQPSEGETDEREVWDMSEASPAFEVIYLRMDAKEICGDEQRKCRVREK